MYLTAFTVVLWYDMSGPSAVGLKYNLLKGRGCEFNGLRFTSMRGVFRQKNGSNERVSAAIRAAVILAITLTAGCGVPSVTNVTPERVVTGEASATAGTQFPAGGEPVAVAMTPNAKESKPAPKITYCATPRLSASVNSSST
jgi:hypothetical protein